MSLNFQVHGTPEYVERICAQYGVFIQPEAHMSIEVKNCRFGPAVEIHVWPGGPDNGARLTGALDAAQDLDGVVIVHPGEWAIKDTLRIEQKRGGVRVRK